MWIGLFPHRPRSSEKSLRLHSHRHAPPFSLPVGGVVVIHRVVVVGARAFVGQQPFRSRPRTRLWSDSGRPRRLIATQESMLQLCKSLFSWQRIGWEKTQDTQAEDFMFLRSFAALICGCGFAALCLFVANLVNNPSKKRQKIPVDTPDRALVACRHVW